MKFSHQIGQNAEIVLGDVSLDKLMGSDDIRMDEADGTYFFKRVIVSLDMSSRADVPVAELGAFDPSLVIYLPYEPTLKIMQIAIAAKKAARLAVVEHDFISPVDANKSRVSHYFGDAGQISVNYSPDI